ncbi:DNA-processing protein DprA [Thiocystis violascens]|uniref:DNA protecting protein DprA n=1 Tax=Thiocystis violascens (strain ATCC 17096 / DSM 198 / 6111) TaxID=765911 RepID=I3YDK9_THIV6|nr:DNA-processing protein DprA [Thiocystis violascens]AFL75077.1 DNA protecting protein DprA [Thiocystis violascens DSM 198]
MSPRSNPLDAPLDAWLALANAPGIGPRTVARLIEHFGSPVAVLRASPERLAAAGLKPASVAALKQPDPDALAAVLDWSAQPDAHILTLADPRYPPLLAEIHDAPPLLYVRGDAGLLAEPQIAIVGSRNPTPGGLETTREFARQLVGFGLIVTSGLALGVDGAAHAAALAGGGRTVAVLGTGPDRVYPAVHRDLARRIADTGAGALVSEFPPGQGPLARNFPRRNRLISGLSLGVLVTEAALKSGSLITARTALEQGREVFAVPGSIRNPLARGCHALIRDGARLVESAQEILVELAPLLHCALAAPDSALAATAATAVDLTEAEAAPDLSVSLDAESQRLLNSMGFDPVAPDELIERSGLPAQRVAAMLLVLELSGHVSSAPGGRYHRSRA